MSNAQDATATILEAVAVRMLEEHDRLSRGDIRESTYDVTAHRLQQLAELLGPGTLLSELDRERINQFLNRRLRQVSRHTVTKERAVLRQVLRTARIAGLYPHPVKDVLDPGWRSGYVPRDRWLTKVEAERLWDALRVRNQQAHVALILGTGARTSEVRGITLDDVSETEVVIRGTKNELATRAVPVLPWTRQWVERGYGALMDDGREQVREWSTVTRDLSAACRRAGIDHCNLIDLRRTACTWLRLHRCPREYAADYMGHASETMVAQVYGRLQGEALGELIMAAIAGLRGGGD